MNPDHFRNGAPRIEEVLKSSIGTHAIEHSTMKWECFCFADNGGNMRACVTNRGHRDRAVGGNDLTISLGCRRARVITSSGPHIEVPSSGAQLKQLQNTPLVGRVEGLRPDSVEDSNPCARIFLPIDGCKAVLWFLRHS